ncbi:CD209 antigen-like protein A [Perca flavescens]|uniref:CD209 antigen-like protein A n=1 Tax=Perca flavescens TaxID=8167 RepID=UPI00106E22E2|nr:CD209 antigen-like protein A [Perca flavescens]
MVQAPDLASVCFYVTLYVDAPDWPTESAASLVLNRMFQKEIDEEEDDYVNAPAWTVDKVAAPPDQRSVFFSQSFPLIAVCWLILVVIMGLRIYFDTLSHQSDESELVAANRNLTNLNNKLSLDNEKLRRDNNNLTEQIQNMEINWNKLNVSQVCKVCQNGWLLSGSNCYAYNNAPLADRKTWEEARKDCRGKGSDLVVVHNEEEKCALNEFSWGSSGTNGYWFGLKAEAGRWKWIDGSDLTVSYWTPQPPPPATDGQCVMSVQNVGWRSVNCAEKKQWICQKKALSV